MTVPPQGPPPSAREQWGTGLPGIPSIWDTASPETFVEPAGRGSSFTTIRQRAAPSALRRVGLGISLVVLLAVGASALDREDVEVVGQPTHIAPGIPAAPLPVGPPPGPVGPPPVAVPGPGEVLPLPQAAPGPPAGLVAQRADGGGEPFGLPLGTTVVLSDPAAGSRLDVRVLSAVRDDGRLLVDVEMGTPTSTAGTVVPALLLRLPDGRELPYTGLTDGQDVPPVLGQGLLWRGTLLFDVGPVAAALVLDDGRTLAGWTIPAG